MRKFFVVSLCYLILICPPVLAQTNGMLTQQLKSNPHQKYYLYLPKDYDASRKYPLFIGIHWAQGTAQQQINHWHNYTNRDQYILLCPQFKEGYQQLQHKEDHMLIQIMDEVAAEFPYDAQKVYLAGCSGGGQFAHRFVLKHPQLIYASAILAAGSYSTFRPNPSLAKVKFFVGVGENDSQRVDITRQFAQSLLDNGNDVQFKIFPGLGHSCGIDTQIAVADYLQGLAVSP